MSTFYINKNMYITYANMCAKMADNTESDFASASNHSGGLRNMLSPVATCDKEGVSQKHIFSAKVKVTATFYK